MKFVVMMTLLSGLLQAQIAVINGQAVLISTQEGKKAYDQLRGKLDTRKKEFEARQNEIAQLEDQLAKGAAVMTGERREQLANTLNDKKKRLQRDVQDAEEESQKDQQQTFQPLQDKVDAIIDKYASDKKYTVVIDVSTPGNPVRYAAPGVDITKDVIALYDKAYPK